MKSDYFSESPAFTDFQTKLAQEFARLYAEIDRLRKELEESERLLDEYQREAADRTRWENTND